MTEVGNDQSAQERDQGPIVMALHEFMTTERDAILAACLEQLRNKNGASDAVEADVVAFFDEVVGALRRGHADDFDLATSRAATRVGARQHRAGLDPAQVPMIFGAISQAIGQVGEDHQLTIGADEYGIFNHCIDAGIAVSIGKFWEREKRARVQRINEQFGYLAHELRNAVGNAAMAFKLLRLENLEFDGRTAQVLANNLVRMETLVARTLGSVQLESGTELELRPIRVASVLRNLQASAIPERAITIALELDDSLHVNADEMLLTSAASNILHNAIKFTRTGGHIVLACRADEDGVVIDVEDECGGLPPGNPRELLEPFVKRGDNPQNFGLGLAVTLRATEAMGGSVEIEDHPGHGCVFQLRFPSVPRPPSSRPPPPGED